MLHYKMSTILGKSIKYLIKPQKNVLGVARYTISEVNRAENVEEVKIPMPWGHIAGKWWGNKLLTPVLAIHGWQDNANTFDNLIPLLNIPSILVIDLPGHGYSTHLPEGKAYDFVEHVIMLHRIKKHFNWTKIPLLTHSLGGALGFAYASIFPEEVKWLINFECARTLMTLFRTNLSSTMSQGVDDFLKIEKQKKEKSPPAYKLSKMIEMAIDGSLGSIASPEAAMVLLKRGIYLVDYEPSSVKSGEISSEDIDLRGLITYEKEAAMLMSDLEKREFMKAFSVLMESMKKGKERIKQFDLSESKDKYYSYKRDPSVKVLVFQSFDEEFVIEASKNIKCPVLSIRAKNGFLFGSTRKFYEKTLDNLKKSSSYMEHHDIDGTHHAHLNTPDLLAPVINKFVLRFTETEAL